jgi:hypothetical protein
LSRNILLVGLLVQFATTLLGIILLYQCINVSPSGGHKFLEATQNGVVGPIYLMWMNAPLTVPVVGGLLLLFFSGWRWRRLRWMWIIGIVLWGGWWVLLAYVMCAVAND